MSTLFTMPGTCSLAPNIAVSWLDAPIEINNMAYGDHKKSEYLAINPKGKVHALQFDDGEVLTEATAILTYLGATYGGKGSDEFARTERLGMRESEALSYMTSEVHADFGPHFSVERFATSDAAQKEVKAKTYERLAKHYDYMNKVLESKCNNWYLGEKSFADTFLYVLTRWIK